MTGGQGVNGQAPVREPMDPLRVLTGCGWLTADEAADPRLRLEDRSSSHTVCRVSSADGRSVIVKLAPAKAVASGRTLGRECFVYRLAAWIPELAAVLPSPVFIDEARHVVVLRAINEARPDAGAPSIESAWVAAELGKAMAAWHRSTETLALWPSPATGVLHMPDALGDAVQGRPPQTQRLMRAIADDPTLSGGLRSARALWQDRCLIHGDMRPENWMHDREAGPAALKVVDWELAGSGDPAWDVGSVLAEATLALVRHGAPPPDRGAPWSSAAARAIPEFLDAYAANGGIADAASPGGSQRLVLLAAARLVHVACEWSDVQPDGDGWLCHAILEHARAYMDDRTALARSICQ